MYPESPMQRLLAENRWDAHQPLLDRFGASPYGGALTQALEKLDRQALYMSHVHGLGHIERTLLHGAMCAMDEGLDAADTSLLLEMCAYHDTGRENDWLDPEHGYRAAGKLAALTGRSGADLALMRAGVDAHSRNDRFLEDSLTRYAPPDRDKARRLAQLLKDADGLDRVRIGDLNPQYLRRESSRGRADFAQYLFDRYRALELAQAERSQPEGFDLPTILSVKRFVERSQSQGRTCAQTALLALGNLTGRVVGPEPLRRAGEDGGGVCGLLTGARLFMDAYGGGDGGGDALEARFAAQYGSVRCQALGGGRERCGGFAVDGILFALQCIRNENYIDGAGRP